MSRRLASTVALVLLLALTIATWSLHTRGGGPGPVAGVAVAKGCLILLVFLELDRAWWGWAGIALLLVAGIAGGAAVLLGGG